MTGCEASGGGGRALGAAAAAVLHRRAVGSPFYSHPRNCALASPIPDRHERARAKNRQARHNERVVDISPIGHHCTLVCGREGLAWHH